MIYFIGEPGGIKIGYSCYRRIERRLGSMQTCNPRKLSILARAGGTLRAEKQLHQSLSPHRIHGEWYHRHSEILTIIDIAREWWRAHGSAMEHSTNPERFELIGPFEKGGRS